MVPKPARSGIYRLTVDLPERVFNALEAMLDEQREQYGGANRNATIVRIIADALREKGYLREGARKGKRGSKS